MEKWYEIKKGADFQAIAERFGISPVTARLIRNRGVIGDAVIDKYLNGTCREDRSGSLEITTSTA